MCAVLGITSQDAAKSPLHLKSEPNRRRWSGSDFNCNEPPYIRVLAMNTMGMKLLSKARKKAKLPIITKPASVYELNNTAIKLFESEAAATDLYVLAFQKEEERKGAQEWRLSPIVVRD